MELIAVGQETGEVSVEDYEAAQSNGPVAPPAMAGLDEMLHRLKLDTPEYNPFVSEPPVGSS